MSLLRPTFMGFETGKRAIEVNQKAIDIVANNLSNVDTPGYTRQRLDVASITPSAYAMRVSGSKIGVMGQGIEALGVSQIRDVFLDKRFRDEYGKAAYHSQSATLLKDIQAALGDGGDITDESALFGALAQIYRALHDYAYEPTLESQANIVLAAFRNFTKVLQQLDAKLDSVADAQIFDVSLDVDRVNEIFNEIAHYNYLISRDTTVMADPNNEYFRPNELLDKRNLLLDELAGFGDINVTTLANGMVNVDFADRRAVDGKDYTSIRLDVRNDKTIGIVWNDTGNDVKFAEGSGSLKANRDFLNGRGINAQNPYETVNEGIPFYRDKLDTMAQAFANLVNNIIPEVRKPASPEEPYNSEPLTDDDGNIIYKNLIGARVAETYINSDGVEEARYVVYPEGKVTAANINISDEWEKNGPGYFIYDKNENIDNYALQICVGLTSKEQKFISPSSTFTGTFEDYVADYVTKLASQIKYQEGRFESTAMMADDFLDRRDEISGVNRDEETANMLIFQKSYNAAARLITTLDEMIDVIVNRMGLVGR